MKKITSLVLSLMLVCCSGNAVSAENSEEKIGSSALLVDRFTGNPRHT